jgi:hypothetical protein
MLSLMHYLTNNHVTNADVILLLSHIVFKALMLLPVLEIFTMSYFDITKCDLNLSLGHFILKIFKTFI